MGDPPFKTCHSLGPPLLPPYLNMPESEHLWVAYPFMDVPTPTTSFLGNCSVGSRCILNGTARAIVNTRELSAPRSMAPTQVYRDRELSAPRSMRRHRDRELRLLPLRFRNTPKGLESVTSLSKCRSFYAPSDRDRCCSNGTNV